VKRILFYSSVNSLELFKTQKFYQIDISILKDLGYDVLLSNRIFDSLLFWKYDILFSYFYRYSFFAALLAKCFGKKHILQEVLTLWIRIMHLLLIIKYKHCFLNFVIGWLILV